jgi:hypothetical protein
MQQVDVMPVAPVGQEIKLLPPKSKPEPVKLDHLKKKIALYDKAVAEYNELGAEIERLQKEIQAEMGNAQAATVAGVQVFTFNMKNSWRTKDLQADYGNITKDYMVPSDKLVFDVKKFAADHPAIASQYQTREFRRTSGRRNAVS